MNSEDCACGQPLHYPDPAIREKVEQIVENLGPFVHVTTPEGTWRVQRHYIALHGLKAEELPSLGLFKKVKGG